MTTIESETVTIDQSPNEVFDFLSNFHNFEKLMPEQVVNWESDGEKCSFDIKGMASLGMAYESKEKPGRIKIKKEGKAPFDFFLNCHIDDENGGSNLKLVFDADLNPMLKMMAVKPLNNFLNMLVSKFKELSESNDLSAITKK
jgi:carbon monoxide dehydrogenase subunit G